MTKTKFNPYATMQKIAYKTIHLFRHSFILLVMLSSGSLLQAAEVWGPRAIEKKEKFCNKVKTSIPYVKLDDSKKIFEPTDTYEKYFYGEENINEAEKIKKLQKEYYALCELANGFKANLTSEEIENFLFDVIAYSPTLKDQRGVYKQKQARFMIILAAIHIQFLLKECHKYGDKVRKNDHQRGKMSNFFAKTPVIRWIFRNINAESKERQIVNFLDYLIQEVSPLADELHRWLESEKETNHLSMTSMDMANDILRKKERAAQKGDEEKTIRDVRKRIQMKWGKYLGKNSQYGSHTFGQSLKNNWKTVIFVTFTGVVTFISIGTVLTEDTDNGYEGDDDPDNDLDKDLNIDIDEDDQNAEEENQDDEEEDTDQEESS